MQISPEKIGWHRGGMTLQRQALPAGQLRSGGDETDLARYNGPVAEGERR
jgi:hypothetical protein